MAEQDQDDTLPAAPLGGTRAQAVQRLQLGLSGLAATILMIGLAQIFSNQARESEAGIVPEAAPTVVPSPTDSPASDPLADAGIGPDMPDEREQPQATDTPSADSGAREAD